MQPKKHNPAWEHIKLYIWVILIFELLLFCLALVFGKFTDFGFAFSVCFWMGLILAVVFLSILLLNLLGIVTFAFVERLKETLSGRKSGLTTAVNIYDIPDLKTVLRNADHVDVKTVQGRASLSGFIAAMLTYSPAWLVFFYPAELRSRKIARRVDQMIIDITVKIKLDLLVAKAKGLEGPEGCYFRQRHRLDLCHGRHRCHAGFCHSALCPLCPWRSHDVGRLHFLHAGCGLS